MSLFLILAAVATAPSHVDVLTAEAIGIYRDCAVENALRLDDGKETVSVIAKAGLTACSNIRPKLLKTLTMGLMHRAGMPATTENWSAAQRMASEELETVDSSIERKGELALLEKRKKKKS